jgi:hypothetical protein
LKPALEASLNPRASAANSLSGVEEGWPKRKWASSCPTANAISEVLKRERAPAEITIWDSVTYTSGFLEESKYMDGALCILFLTTIWEYTSLTSCDVAASDGEEQISINKNIFIECSQVVADWGFLFDYVKKSPSMALELSAKGGQMFFVNKVGKEGIAPSESTYHEICWLIPMFFPVIKGQF